MTTRLDRTLERFEQAQRLAAEHRNANTLPPDLTPVGLKAAAQRQFAQIWWSVQHPHGQQATPRVTIQGKIIRCDVTLTGSPDPGTDTDWSSFETRIDQLPAATYRIITPKNEVTLVVPDHTTH